MISVKDRLRHLELVLAEAAELQLRNEIAIANMMRDGDAFRDRLDHYAANIDALGRKLEYYADRTGQHSVKLEQHSAELREHTSRLEGQILESRQERKRMNKAWGDLANKLGTVAEDVVAPNVRRMATGDLGMEAVEDLVVRAHRTSRRGPRRLAEFDIVCAGPGKVVVVEVKSTPTAYNIRELPAKLPEFFDFYPEYEGRELIGVFASWSIPDMLLPLISEAGLYGIAMGDEVMAVVARPAGVH